MLISDDLSEEPRMGNNNKEINGWLWKHGAERMGVILCVSSEQEAFGHLPPWLIIGNGHGTYPTLAKDTENPR